MTFKQGTTNGDSRYPQTTYRTEIGPYKGTTMDIVGTLVFRAMGFVLLGSC